MGIDGISSLAGLTTTNANTAGIEKESSGDASFEQSLKNAYNNNNPEELKKACQDFEGILLNMMYSEMRATIQKSDLIPEDSGMDIFQSMMDEEMTKQVSEGGGIGLADMLYDQLSKGLPESSSSEE